MEFPEDFEDKSYGKGSLLVANPVLPDPNFSRTVVLLCNHDDQGSFGLVINRAAQLEASEVFSHIRFLDTYRGKIYVGGPVSPAMVFSEYSLLTSARRMDSLIVSFVFLLAITLFFVSLVSFMSLRHNCIGGPRDVKVT